MKRAARIHPDEDGSNAPCGWYDYGDTRRHWDGEKWGKYWGDPMQPGWHMKEGSLRYFDGSSWTDLILPPFPESLTTTRIAFAVFLGVLAALFVIWVGAQVSPEHIYLPIKFVAKELPTLR